MFGSNVMFGHYVWSLCLVTMFGWSVMFRCGWIYFSVSVGSGSESFIRRSTMSDCRTMYVRVNIVARNF
jgi:hypothetical protein